jgi:heme-degrading monooxygenase HmoA
MDDEAYYAVIFSSRLRANDRDYERMAERMVELAAGQPGFVGFESARGEGRSGISISYWRDLDAIAAWRRNAEHLVAQELGREKWYESYRLRIARVERDYRWAVDSDADPVAGRE